MKAIQTMEDSTNAGELCQFVRCFRWMSSSLPDFHRRMRTLDAILQSAYEHVGKRKKSSLRSIPLHKLSWGTEQRKAIASLHDSFRSAVKKAFPKPGKVVCVYTDARKTLCAAIVTQTVEMQLEKSVE